MLFQSLRYFFVLSWSMLVCDSFREMLFQKTANLTSVSWSRARHKTLGATRIGTCGGACLKNPHSCNAFLYNKDLRTCQLGNVTFLEDTDGNETVNIHVDVNVIKQVDQICRGGKHCCNSESAYLCDSGEGDCNVDSDCREGTLCSKGACVATFGFSGGLWDANDDCCENKCTPQHPCDHGQGICETAEDCKIPSLFLCETCSTYSYECHSADTKGEDYVGIINKTKSGLTCQTWSSMSPHSHSLGSLGDHNYCRNSDGMDGAWCYTTNPSKRWEYCDIPICGYKPTDKCCRTKCIPSSPCAFSYSGCGVDADCMPGLECKDVLGMPTCIDIDECKEDTTLCEDTEACINLVTAYNNPDVGKGYRCVKKGEEKAAVVIGGKDFRTDSLPKSVEVLTRGRKTCTSHSIPKPTFQFYLGGGTYVKEHILICGGNTNGKVLNSCYALNLAVAGSKWKKVASMNRIRQQFPLVELNGFAYAIAGRGNQGNHLHVERYDIQENKWTRMADTYGGYKICWHAQSCSTSLRNEIWVFGGKENDVHHRGIFIYSASSNSWYLHPYLLDYEILGLACAVVKNSKNDHEMMLITGGVWTSGSAYGGTKWWDLTENTGWFNLPYTARNKRMSFVPLSPYEAYLLGGHVEDQSSTRGNWYQWNEYEQSIMMTQSDLMAEDHWHGAFASVPSDLAMVKDCFA